MYAMPVHHTATVHTEADGCAGCMHVGERMHIGGATCIDIYVGERMHIGGATCIYTCT